ncbi:hypothetical protein CHUAL_013206 [Chamberlinius hualienensis]
MAFRKPLIIFLVGIYFAFATAQNNAVAQSLATYVNQALTNFRDIMKTGLPEFGIAPLDPIKLNNMTFNGSGQGVTINQANFTNVTLYGLSTLHISNVQVKSSNLLTQPLKLTLKLKFDNWTLNSKYEMSGKVIGFIPLNGNGTMDMELTDVVIDASANLTSNPNGTFSIKQKDMNLDIATDDIKVHFHGLYGGGAMSGFANRIANFFSGRIFNNAKPRLIEKMTSTLQSSINRKLENIKLL